MTPPKGPALFAGKRQQFEIFLYIQLSSVVQLTIGNLHEADIRLSTSSSRAGCSGGDFDLHRIVLVDVRCTFDYATSTECQVG